MKKIILTMIRSRIKCEEVVWFLHKKKHLRRQGRIQALATKLVLELKELTNKESLKEMQPVTIEEKIKWRPDDIHIYKLNG